jgi:hypothetical protein
LVPPDELDELPDVPDVLELLDGGAVAATV